MRRSLHVRAFAVAAVTTGVALAAGSIAVASTTIDYTGQGFEQDDDGSFVLEDERCGLTGQNDADDGGTGQFADWNGPGQPYEEGQPYLVWVLTANRATSATLHLPDGTVDMIQVGGTYKFASGWYDPEDLIDQVFATYEGNVRGNVQLVVSHGCRPFDESEGAWCSPGFWRNAQDGAWVHTGFDRNVDKFNDHVFPVWYGDTFAVDPTLQTVLDNPPTYSGPPLAGTSGYPLNAYNATGAMLTDALPGFSFDISLMGEDEVCPLDNHGNFK